MPERETIDASAINAAPLWQQVAAGIRRSIVAGRLRPGERVVEAQLARQLGISRNPIREALRQLQQQGILEYRPNVGAIVAHVSPQDAGLAAEMRIFLETQAVRLLMRRADAGGLARLERIVQAMGDLTGESSAEEMEALDAEFHRCLIEAGGSPMLRRVWETVDPYVWMLLHTWEKRERGFVPDHRMLYEDHRRLLDTLRAGDAGAAEFELRHHIQKSHYEQALTNGG